jgi:hypothetical protein
MASRVSSLARFREPLELAHHLHLGGGAKATGCGQVLKIAAFCVTNVCRATQRRQREVSFTV